LPVPSHYPPLTPRLRPRSLVLGDLGYPAGVSAALSQQAQTGVDILVPSVRLSVI